MRRFYISSLIPCEIYLPPEQVLRISDSPVIDVCNSYLEYSEDIRIPQGVRIVGEGVFENMSEAEQWGRGLAMSWAGLLCFTMGVRSVFPRPLCLLEELDKTGRYRMRKYWYDVLPSPPGRPLSFEMLTSIHQRLSSLPKNDDSDRISLAMRWYLTGLGEADDSVRFLAHWIGMEAIGDILHRRLHTSGRSACAVCDHKAGERHRGRQGGMKHVLSVVSGQPKLYEILDHTRDRMFHGLEDLQGLMNVIVDNVAVLETALGRGILEAITPQGSGQSTSATEPMRSVNTFPQVILNATVIDLTEEERNLLLYHDPLKISSSVVSVEYADDGKLMMSLNYALSGPPSLQPRVVDQRFSLISPPGMDIQLADPPET